MRISHFFCLVLIWILSFSHVAMAQSGPGGVGDTTGISSLRLWLTSDYGPSTSTHNTAVTSWSDRSGADNDLTAGSNNKPTFQEQIQNGYPAVTFSGSHYLQSSSKGSFSNTSLTMFVVVKNYTSGAALAIGDGNTNWNNEYLLLDRQGYLHRSSGNYMTNKHQCADSLGPDNCQVHAVRFNYGQNTVETYINGSLTNTSTTSEGSNFAFSNINRIITLGQRNAFVGTEYLRGGVLEVIVHNTALNDGAVNSINTYLINKYGLSSAPCAYTASLKPIQNPNALSRLYPNPVAETFSFSDADDLTNGSLITVYNYLGQQVKSFESTRENIYNISELQPGVYFVEMTQNGVISTFKILKN